MNKANLNLGTTLTKTTHGRNRWTLACLALLGALALAILPWIPLAHAADAVDRTPLVRSQALQTAPAGYRQLAIPAAYLGALTPRSRTVEFRLTYGGKPATLAVTRNEKGQLVNAFASGLFPLTGFTRGAGAGSPPARHRITSSKEFWDTLRDRINDCKKQYPNDATKREECIDGAIFKTLGDLFV
jgi:hypothetical protein